MVLTRSKAVAWLAGATLLTGGLVPLATAGPAAAAALVSDPAALVHPLIGTSGAVDDFPGADVPFGMVQWSPDTPSRPAGGGYEYTDQAITGYSLTHISGPGCPAAGDIPILPTTGAIGTDPAGATQPLSHAAEIAQAGYYKLTAGGITTELTSTTRSGAAKFTFPASTAANLVLKLSDSATGSSATRFQVINDHEVQGSVTSGNFCGADDTYTAYFDLVFDQPLTGYGTYQNSAIAAGNAKADVTRQVAARAPRTTRSTNGVVRRSPDVAGKTAAVTPPVVGSDGAYLTFDTSTHRSVQANVGLSYVSNANARQNRITENPTFDFATVRAAAHASWNTTLGKIRIGGGDLTAQQTFYTAMYHALLHPNVFSDSNGQYAGFDGQVHRAAAGHVEYANYSGWDIYRSQVQLAAMVAPQQTSDSIRSMLNQYDQTGQLPKWALNNGESYVMVGDPADPVIADAYAFGATDFDTAHALTAMQTEADQPGNVRPGNADYLDRGYLPSDGSYGCCNFYGPVSTQQEYNTADSAIASFARALGQPGIAATFASRANNWQHVFNPASGYLQAKNAAGSFAGGFAPETSDGFVEGTSAQYTPMEPFDIAGLIAAAGGKANWISKLDSLTANVKHPTAANADFGNEPSIEIPWEYDYAGVPYKTQAKVREIQQQIFTNTPAGIAGNDDLGTMSAWYVWSALGFYPETPGTADLALGSPVFANAQVSLPSAKLLTVSAPAAARTAPYVQSMTVNSAPWTHAYLAPSLVTAGGTVAFALGSTANRAFGSAAADAPPSNTSGLYSALGYTAQSVVVAAPGSSVDVEVGARNLLGTEQTVSWSAIAGEGLTAGPASGSLILAKNALHAQPVAVTVPKTEGRYYQSFSLRDGTGRALSKVVVEVDSAKPGSLWPYYNNAGTSTDGAQGSASFDGDGYSYSAAQLSSAGLGRGATFSAAGLTYHWPDAATGGLDNIESGGQTVPLPSTPGAAKLGIVGSATNASPGAQGNFTVHYTDGTSSVLQLGLADWTLQGGAVSTPSYGNTVVARTGYRNTSNGGRDPVATFLFAANGAVTAGKTVASVTLPTDTDGGQLHVFAFALG